MVERVRLSKTTRIALERQNVGREQAVHKQSIGTEPRRQLRRSRPVADAGRQAADHAVSVDGYDIGYARPPTKTQFKKGQSGNPKGRPKHSHSIKTIIEETLTASISIREGDKLRKVSKLQAIILQTSIKALKGDNGAAQTILKYAAQAGLVNPTEAIRESPQLSAAEQAILDEVKVLLPTNGARRK